MKIYTAVHVNTGQAWPKVWAGIEDGFTAWGTVQAINAKDTSNTPSEKHAEKLREGYLDLGIYPVDGNNHEVVREVARVLAQISAVCARGRPHRETLPCFTGMSADDSAQLLIKLLSALRVVPRIGTVNDVGLPDGSAFSIMTGQVVRLSRAAEPPVAAATIEQVDAVLKAVKVNAPTHGDVISSTAW